MPAPMRGAWFPAIRQGLAYVEIGDEVWLDASEKDTPVELFPPDVVGTEGLLIEKIDTYEWG